MVERMERTFPVTAVRDATSNQRFRPGQAVVGRVERVEETKGGERVALVRVGSQLVSARLEASLILGRTYLFEIKQQGGTLYWKATPFPERTFILSDEEAARQWQQTWKLPAAALPVLRQALKAGAVVTKREIVELAEAVRETGRSADAEDVIAYLFRRRLPPSSAVFRALWAAKTGAPLAFGLGRLKAALAALSTHPAALDLGRAVDRLLSPPLFVYETVVHVLLSAEGQEAEPARSLLARLGLTPLPEKRRLALQEAVRQRQFAEAGRQLGLADEEALFARFAAVDAAYKNEELSEAEAKLWAAARATGDPALSLFHWLRRMAKRLGLGDEAALARAVKTGALPAGPSSLKRLLLYFLREPGDREAKQAAEALLDQIDGMTIAAGGDGTPEHVWIAFPLSLGSRLSDFAVCWQGKRKPSGRLDEDYSRIVCCLTLETLNEIVVDVRIQRRIVHISIFHDDPQLPALTARFAPLVKERLQAHGYTLSGIDVKTTDTAPPPPSSFPFSGQYSEVDWRI
jgi:hypothetical protein